MHRAGRWWPWSLDVTTAVSSLDEGNGVAVSPSLEAGAGDDS